MARREQDDGRRGPFGVLLSIRRDPAEIEITVDDVALHEPASFENSRNRLWRHQRFTTFLNLPPDLDRSFFTQQKLADFGLTILGCLYPLAKRVDPNDGTV